MVCLALTIPIIGTAHEHAAEPVPRNGLPTGMHCSHYPGPVRVSSMINGF